MKPKIRIDCPVCNDSFHPGKWLSLGDTLTCPNCEEELEVVQSKPLVVVGVDSLDFQYEDEED